ANAYKVPRDGGAQRPASRRAASYPPGPARSVGRDGVAELPEELERLAGPLDHEPQLAQVGVHDVALIEHEIGVAAEHRERAQRLAMQMSVIAHTDGGDAVAGAIAARGAADRGALLAVPEPVHQPRARVLDR